MTLNFSISYLQLATAAAPVGAAKKGSSAENSGVDGAKTIAYFQWVPGISSVQHFLCLGRLAL